jgi:hypothetical protein
MEENVVSKALDEVNSFLGGEAAWINDSSLHLRAFYLGVYVGLGQFASEGDRRRVLLEIAHKTMFARAGDDLVGASFLGAKLKDCRERLLHSLDSSRGKRSSLDGDDVKSFRELAHLIEQLDQKWRLHYDVAQCELGGIQSGTVSSEKALKALDVVDSSFREMFRALTERSVSSDRS